MIEVKIIKAEEAIKGLREIFRELQDFETGFHDRWDWIHAEFFVDVLEAEIQYLNQ